MLRPRWRLIDTGPLDGISNMAVDEALVASFDPAASLPVLRFYGWNPPTLSLGRFQDAAATLDLHECGADNVPVVRRMTGGGVIFHHDELTYSIVCSQDQVGAGVSVKESLRRLCSFLIAGYRRLGIDAVFAVDVPGAGGLGERTSFCFAGREQYDIVARGRKIGGNAQRRSRNVIFQHGSIPLRGEIDAGMKYMQSHDLRPACATTLEGLGVGVTADVVQAVLAESFAETLGVDLSTDDMSEAEIGRRDDLQTKYRSESWTMHGQWPEIDITGGR